jgi:hypothetical protein
VALDSVAVSGLPTIGVNAMAGDVCILDVQVVPIVSDLLIVRCSNIVVRSDPSAATSLVVGNMEAAHRLAAEVVGRRAGVGYGLDSNCSHRLDRRCLPFWISTFS